MLGSVYVVNSLSAEEKAIAINLNMDMLGGIADAAGGAKLNAVSMDINPRPLAFNLPAYLVTDGAANVTWADGIENVRTDPRVINPMILSPGRGLQHFANLTSQPSRPSTITPLLLALRFTG